MNIYLFYMWLPLLFILQVVSSLILFFIPRRFRSKKNIKRQKVLITGAGSGIGRQLAVEFSKHAPCLILVDINKQSLLETEKLIDSPSPVFIYECDVSDYEKVCKMAKKVKEEAGDIDILVNNAGIVSGKYLMDLSKREILNTMGVNAFAHFWTCKAFLPAMMKKNSGHLVSITSLLGKSGSSRLSDYCASKFAALGFAESIELEMRELKLDGIKVTIVLPAFTDTGLFQGVKINTGYTYTPEYVAKEIVLGVIQERETISFDPFLNGALFFKPFLPRWFVIKLHELSGDIKAMKNFTGRASNDVQQDKVTFEDSMNPVGKKL